MSEPKRDNKKYLEKMIKYLTKISEAAKLKKVLIITSRIVIFMKFYLGFYTLILLVYPAALPAQNTVNLLQALNLKTEILSDGSTMRFLEGSPQHPVIFKRQKLLLYCQKATQNNSDNILHASGQVKIINEDSLIITGQRLEYDQISGLVKIWGDKVVMKDTATTLTTDMLLYDAINRHANYYTGGIITRGNNRLKSQKGYWSKTQNLLNFKGNINLIDTSNQDFLYSDTLQYNLKQDIIYFYSPTLIKNEDGTMQSDSGQYYKTTKRFNSYTKTRIETEEYILKGEKVFYDRVADTALALGKVSIFHKEHKSIIFADKMRRQNKNNQIFAYGNVMVERIQDQDTLYISGDTLINIQDTAANKQEAFMYPNVKIFSKKMTARCDYLTYYWIDSVLHMKQDPVVWSKKAQITADAIIATVRSEDIDSIFLEEKPFIILQDTLDNPNQIKGRTMKINIEESAIEKLDVFGNGETLYYILKGDTVLSGLNLVTCSDMHFSFAPENKLERVVFMNKPEGKVIPPHLIEEGDKVLRDFKLRFEEQPLKQSFIDLKRFPAIQILQVEPPTH